MLFLKTTKWNSPVTLADDSNPVKKRLVFEPLHCPVSPSSESTSTNHYQGHGEVGEHAPLPGSLRRWRSPPPSSTASSPRSAGPPAPPPSPTPRPPPHPSPASPTPSRPSTRAPPPPPRRSSGAGAATPPEGFSVALGPPSAPTVGLPGAGRVANAKAAPPPSVMALRTGGCSARSGSMDPWALFLLNLIH
jgi:hypothetical protein